MYNKTMDEKNHKNHRLNTMDEPNTMIQGTNTMDILSQNHGLTRESQINPLNH